ncbi:MAG: hypothetical protein D4R90_01900 [Nitrosopumilales archaeon]|nr:MAG: hypothetical protein D4R90_01900 [Nitrosopumilales archaeon]
MIKIVILFTIACILFPSVVFLSAYGDGLASETLPPSMIGNKNVTLSINTSPFLIDNYHAGTQINFVLLDVSNQQPIPQATIAVSVFRGDKAVLGHVFMSDSGNFLLDLIPDSSANKISIDEQGGPLPGLLGHSGEYNIRGPTFSAGGLYKFKIEVLTMGSYDNQVSKSFNAGVSIPETNNYQVYDKEYGNQNVTIIAYYDQISNFQYNSNDKTMNFVMPFNWSQDNIKQVSVVHQELKIPKSFGEFIVTKYDASINGVKLPDKAVSIDDYSSDERIVHLIVYKEELIKIAKQQDGTKQEMNFSLTPSNTTSFPIIQFTRNAQYKVSISWDPPKILPGSTTRFSFQILDPYLINKTVDSIDYDFSIIAGKNGAIFHKSGTTDNNGNMNTIDTQFPSNYTGTITIAFDNLNGNSFADSEFSGVVSPPTIVPEFPIGALTIIAILFSTIILFPKLVKK